MRLLKPHWVTHGVASKKDVLPRPIYTLDIHPDGKRLATGGLSDNGGLIILWDMVFIRDPTSESPSAVKLFQMDNHQACVNCVRWSPTGRYLASGGMDRVIMLWLKTASGSRSSGVFGASENMKFSERWRCSIVLRHHTGDIIDLAWAQDGTRLASASIDNTVVIWKATGTTQQPFQCNAVLRGHKAPVKGVTWDPAGRYLATQADDVGVRIWRTADWQLESKISAPFINTSDQSQVTRLSWSPDGSVIVAPHATNNTFPTAQLITRNRWQAGLDLVGHEKHVSCARYNPNLMRKSSTTGSSAMVCVALGSKDRSLSVWVRDFVQICNLSPNYIIDSLQTTLGRRAIVVIRDLFTNSVADLTCGIKVGWWCVRHLHAIPQTHDFIYFINREIQDAGSSSNKETTVACLACAVDNDPASWVSRITEPMRSHRGPGQRRSESSVLVPAAPTVNRLYVQGSGLGVQKLGQITAADDMVERSFDGRELLASSLDGSISYMRFTDEELGKPMKMGEVARIHRKLYGQSLLDGLLVLQASLSLNPAMNKATGDATNADAKSATSLDVNGDAIVLETPEALALQRSQAQLREKLNATSLPSACPTKSQLSATNRPPKPSIQTEVRTKDGRRRITPSFLGTLDCLDEEPPSNLVALTREPVKATDTTPTKTASPPLQPPVGIINGDTLVPKTSESTQSAKTCPPSEVVYAAPSIFSPIQAPATSSASSQKAKASPESNLDLQPPPKKRKRIELTAIATTGDEIETVRQGEEEDKQLGVGVEGIQESAKEPVKEKESKSLLPLPPPPQPPKEKLQKHRKKSRVKIFVDDTEDAEEAGDATGVNDSVSGGSPGKKSPSKASATNKTGSSRCNQSQKFAPSERAQSTTLDQLEACGNSAQFVCCHSTEGPIMVTIANAESDKGAGGVHKVTANRPAEGNTKALWSISTPDRFTCHTNSDNWMALGDAHNRVRLLWCTGSPICPPLILDSPPQYLASTASPFSNATPVLSGSNSPPTSTLLAAVTSAGCLTIFSLLPSTLCVTRSTFGRSLDSLLPSVLVEARIDARNVIVGLEFPPSCRHPVIRLQTGTSLLFHTERRIWMELFNGEANDSAGEFALRAAVAFNRLAPSGPLAAMQRFKRLGKHLEIGACGELPATTPAQRRALVQFLDTQVQLAELFGSPAEFKFWVLRWFRQLIEDDEDERVRQVCLDFIGPFSPVCQTSWEPSIKGFLKRNLVKELLTLFALNLRMQRLYVEMKELLEETLDPLC